MSNAPLSLCAAADDQNLREVTERDDQTQTHIIVSCTSNFFFTDLHNVDDEN